MNREYCLKMVADGRVRIMAGLLAGPVLTVIILAVWLMAGTSQESSGIAAGSVINPIGDKTISDSKQPGLLVRFTQPESQQPDVRISRLASLHVAEDIPPTPFLKAGPFEAVWEGYFEVADEGDYRFHFEGTGRINLKVGGKTVLQSDGSSVSEPVNLPEGTYQLHVNYRSPQAGPSRMRLLWSGTLFRPESLSPEALSHDGTDKTLAQSKQLRRGRELVSRFSCLKCHEPEDPTYFDGDVMPELLRDATDLNEVASRLRTGWMKRWVLDPHAVRSSAKMPHMHFNRQQAADISAWLATLGEAPDAEADERILTEAARVASGGRLYASQGCVACHTLNATGSDEDRLSLADAAEKWYPSALADFLGDPSRHYNWTAMPDFRLNKDEAASLAAFLISETNSGHTPETVAGDAIRGERLIQRSGCASCHAMPVENMQNAHSMESLLNADWQQGWLGSGENKETHPAYPDLSDKDREAIMALAGKGFESLQRQSLIEFATRQVRELDCRACHMIDGQGDRWSELAGEVAHLADDLNEDFHKERPALTWTGEKLQPDWLEGLLGGTLEHEARPWLEARMPAIGAKPDLLARGLIESHGFDGVDFLHIRPDPELIDIGRRLSTDIGGGFGCNFCHGGREDLDMYLFGDRLRPEFFYWKMWTPSRVDPQSGMPQFGSMRDGRTRMRETLEGDAHQQFQAIWHFFVENRISVQDPDAERVVTRWDELYQQMDTGPFFSRAMHIPEGNLKPKGMAIRVGERQQATLHFDHDLLRMSAGWTGEFIRIRSNHDWGTRNSQPPISAGEVKFNNPEVAGWISGWENLQFIDTREEPYGPISSEKGSYKGLHLHGDRVVLSYRVAGTSVLESPWYVDNSETGAFVRDLHIASHAEPLAVLLFDGEGEPVSVERLGTLQVVRIGTNGNSMMAAVRDENRVEFMETSDGHVVLRFDPNEDARTVRVLIRDGQSDQKYAFLELASENGEPADVVSLTEPGPVRWGEPIVTRGEIGEPEGAWAADRITAPVENPFDALMLFTGLDFLDDGRAVLSTLHGDVWIVDGIDDSLEQLTWHRFATGLNMPFGVKVVDGKIYVSNEDELTILHDLNGNGEADYYENFHNLISPGAGAWSQAFGLEADKDGNFYIVRGRGNRLSDFRNGVIRISSDGARMDLIATGFRQPFGMGISPEGHVTVSQQEGTWVPQTPVSIIDLENRKGSFYGYQPDRFRIEDPYPRELGYEPPIVWLPRNIDNSGGGQLWVESDNWGLPRGQMLHLSYGRGTFNKIIYEMIDGDRQGAVVPLGGLNIRPRVGRFHPQDGQMYAAGLSPGGFERVRYTGGKLYLPEEIYAHENGLRMRFNQPLNLEEAGDVANFRIHRWNYLWSEGYGSEFYSIENPDLMGEDDVEVTSVKVLGDGEEIFLEIPDMVPAMQMRIAYDLEAADGTRMSEDIYNTVHKLQPPFEP